MGETASERAAARMRAAIAARDQRGAGVPSAARVEAAIPQLALNPGATARGILARAGYGALSLWALVLSMGLASDAEARPSADSQQRGKAHATVIANRNTARIGPNGIFQPETGARDVVSGGEAIVPVERACEPDRAIGDAAGVPPAGV